jgi:hypothetical protein
VNSEERIHISRSYVFESGAAPIGRLAEGQVNAVEHLAAMCSASMDDTSAETG